MREEINQKLKKIDGISEVHHLHLWSLDGEHHVLTAHVVLAPETPIDNHQALKDRISERLASYQLEHTTIEFELSEERCRDGSR